MAVAPNGLPVKTSSSSTIDDTRRVYTVAELTRLVKQTLEDEVGRVWVEGEISNFRRQASGHCYFTLKDERAQLSAVFFAGAVLTSGTASPARK